MRSTGSGLRRQEEQRLGDPRELAHSARVAHVAFTCTVIGPKGTSCSQAASPAL